MACATSANASSSLTSHGRPASDFRLSPRLSPIGSAQRVRYRSRVSSLWQVQSVLATPCDAKPPDDVELKELLVDTFVGAGFADRDVAATSFIPSAVRARGELLYVRPAPGGPLVGVVVFVSSWSPGRRFAGPGEAELHLLAVRAGQRRSGAGRALLEAVIDRARDSRCERVLLWSQPTMLAAHRLYDTLGFRRVPERDFTQRGRAFLFYQLEL
jgi:ribosomal protein S18 acetylase RimI-like enzyme